MQLKTPYLLFLGDAADQLAAKTADGVAFWRPDSCVGQLRLPACQADLHLPDLTLSEGREAGAQTLLVGVANRGGLISEAWMATLTAALDLGYHIASGLHNRLGDIPALREKADAAGLMLSDVRYPDRQYPLANGIKRSGRRFLTVGTDVSCGKMYTALFMEREMRARGMTADFRATGQTGIFIAGSGVAVDAVIADFIAGTTEWLTPAGDADHWDVVEGQGSLFHASYAGVTLGLIHGSQPDRLVLCHDPARTHMRGLPQQPLPDLVQSIRVNEEAARLTNPDCRVIGISMNTSELDAAAVERVLRAAEDTTGLPAVDPNRHGVSRFVHAL